MTKYISNPNPASTRNTIGDLKLGDCFRFNGEDYIKYGNSSTGYLRLSDGSTAWGFFKEQTVVEIYQTVELKNPI